MAGTVSTEQPPKGIDDDLKEWLTRLVINLNNKLRNVDDYEVLYAVPDKVFIGMTRYFGAAIATTAITAEGLWIYKSTGWAQII